MPTRSSFPTARPNTRRRALYLGVVAMMCCGMVGCSGGDAGASATKSSSSAKVDGKSDSGTGSGAVAPGITPTSAEPIVPKGSTKVNVACRQIHGPLETTLKSANDAVQKNDAASLKKAGDLMTKTANDIPGMAAESEDAKLVELTNAVSTQMKQVASDFAADKNASGEPLTKALKDLIAYCVNTK